MESIALWLVSLIVFPGLLFTIALALFTQYLVRKWSGRLQKRMGPTYVGPFGTLQPLADLIKLVHAKEEVVHRYSMPGLAKFFGILGIAAGISAMLFFPLSPLRIVSDYDYLVYVYLVSIWIPVSLLLMSLAMPGPYTSIGVSRFLSFITVMEPAYFAALLTPMILASADYKPFYSIYATSITVWRYWVNPLTALPLVLALIAAIVTLQAKAMFNPFNIPEAEQEIIAGFETEFSGPVLGIASLLHDVDVAVTAISIVYLLLGGPYPFPHLSIPGILVLIVKYLAVVFVATVIRNAFGRYRLEQALYTIFKYALVPSLIAAVLATIYVWM
ncbi:MAG: NADH-quinone oxidoreductase subunit H [Thermoprotei archaeon]|nr:MAG: NADH-quinone oxidoreductase subunit H [Thermoprotei archaeon]